MIQIINADNDDAKYIINVKQFAKFVVDLAEQVASTDIEEGMRVGVDRNKYQIHIPLPPKIDPSVTMMQVRKLLFGASTCLCYLIIILLKVIKYEANKHLC